MKKLIFDKYYFGDCDKPAYSNYLEYTKTNQFRKIFEDSSKLLSGKILELGCGIGTYKRFALEKNMDWIALDSSDWCYRNKEVKFILSDALEYLQITQKKYDFIVSFNFLECNSTEYLHNLKIFMNEHSKNQIHYSTKNPNPDYYNQDVFKIFEGVKIIG